MYQKHTAEEWREIVNQLQGSKLSQKEFCKENSIASTTLDYWKRKYSTESKKEGFVKIHNPGKKSPMLITLHIGSCYSLEIPESISQESLKNVIMAIKDCQ